MKKEMQHSQDHLLPHGVPVHRVLLLFLVSSCLVVSTGETKAVTVDTAIACHQDIIHIMPHRSIRVIFCSSMFSALDMSNISSVDKKINITNLSPFNLNQRTQSDPTLFQL